MMERPDLTGISPDIVAYIEALEAEVETLQAGSESRSSAPLEPSEPPTTINIVTVSRDGLAKRTPRHHYFRQRRGGMGVFDLDSDEDPPAFLAAVDEGAGLLLITNQGRAFRVPVATILESEVRGRGESIVASLNLRPDEQLAVVVPDTGDAYLTLVTERGQVRRIGAQYLGASLRPGTVIHDPKEGGSPATAAWTSGQADLFIATASGRGIRFAERQVPVRGCLGIRIDPNDRAVGVAGVGEADGVFLLSDDGKGTVRLMAGFSANKAPGAGGKVAMKCERLVGVAGAPAQANPDIFTISQLGKIIRFALEDVPPKEGVVQGVNCMNLRSDVCVALVASG